MNDPPTCPRCGNPVRDPVARANGFCPRCDAFTGVCAASLIAGVLLQGGMADLPAWSHPCPARGTELWNLAIGESGATVVLLCTAHGGALRAGVAKWMRARGLLLEQGGNRHAVT